MKAPLRVVCSGAGGQIAYSLIPRLISGETFGADQPIDMVLFDIPASAQRVHGLAMELTDCSSPLVHSIEEVFDARQAFRDADYIIMLGSKPRGEGQTRADMLQANGLIFREQGDIINEVCKETTRVLVVGNPANTNGLVCALHSRRLPRSNFQALSRLDHNRLVGQLAQELGVTPQDIQGSFIMGNHADTMVPVYEFATVHRGDQTVPVTDLISAERLEEICNIVRKRGAAIIQARGASSACSAACAIVDTLHNWHLGSAGKIVSSCVITDGSQYGIPGELMCSLPLVIDQSGVHVVTSFDLPPRVRSALLVTVEELVDEKEKAS